jgi:hypothetical protein
VSDIPAGKSSVDERAKAGLAVNQASNSAPVQPNPAQNKPAKEVMTVEPDKQEVKVDGKELSINAKKTPLPGERWILVELLGKPSRVLEKANTLLVWDELGLLAYERPGGGPIVAVTVALGELNDFDFWPKKAFRGKLSLDGAVVTANTTIDEINRAKKGKPLAAIYFLKFSSTIDYEDMYVVINKAKDGQYDAGGMLAELVIGAKRPKR